MSLIILDYKISLNVLLKAKQLVCAVFSCIFECRVHLKIQRDLSEVFTANNKFVYLPCFPDHIWGVQKIGTLTL